MPGFGRRSLPSNASISACRPDGENRPGQNGRDFTEDLEKNVGSSKGRGISAAIYRSRKRSDPESFRIVARLEAIQKSGVRMAFQEWANWTILASSRRWGAVEAQHSNVRL